MIRLGGGDRANAGDGGTIDRWQVEVEVAFAVDDG
jgi:flavin-binding protein dodecin